MHSPDKRLLSALAPAKLIIAPCSYRVVNKAHLRVAVPIALFVSGVICIAAAILAGEAEVSLFLIFPVFSGSSGLFMLGTVLILLTFITGFMLLTIGQLELASAASEPQDMGYAEDSSGADRKFGGLVLIGPVPIAFGSDRKIALAMLVLGIVLAIVAVVVITLLLQ
jgi:uncharacterized protein (TIGR00304 family)